MPLQVGVRFIPRSPSLALFILPGLPRAPVNFRRDSADSLPMLDLQPIKCPHCESFVDIDASHCPYCSMSLHDAPWKRHKWSLSGALGSIAILIWWNWDWIRQTALPALHAATGD